MRAAGDLYDLVSNRILGLSLRNERADHRVRARLVHVLAFYLCIALILRSTSHLAAFLTGVHYQSRLKQLSSPTQPEVCNTPPVSSAVVCTEHEDDEDDSEDHDVTLIACSQADRIRLALRV